MITINIATRIGIVLMGLFLAYSVITNMVKKRILEAQGIIWIIAAVFFVIIGIFPKIITGAADILGFEYEPSLLFMLLDCVFLYVIFLCTKWISQLTKRVHELAMHVSLLNQENERIMKRLCSMTGLNKTEL